MVKEGMFQTAREWYYAMRQSSPINDWTVPGHIIEEQELLHTERLSQIADFIGNKSGSYDFFKLTGSEKKRFQFTATNSLAAFILQRNQVHPMFPESLLRYSLIQLATRGKNDEAMHTIFPISVVHRDNVDSASRATVRIVRYSLGEDDLLQSFDETVVKMLRRGVSPVSLSELPPIPLLSPSPIFSELNDNLRETRQGL